MVITSPFLSFSWKTTKIDRSFVNKYMQKLKKYRSSLKIFQKQPRISKKKIGKNKVSQKMFQKKEGVDLSVRITSQSRSPSLMSKQKQSKRNRLSMRSSQRPKKRRRYHPADESELYNQWNWIDWLWPATCLTFFNSSGISGLLPSVIISAWLSSDDTTCRGIIKQRQ